MKNYTIYQIDSFTKEKFKGNPAGVVVNADGLSEEQMQQIAKELNNSETAFLFKPDEPRYDGIIRYFTPTVEVPICGHATIAAMFAKANEENLENGIFYMKTKVGVLPFEIQNNESGIKIWMTQGNIEIQEPLSQDNQKDLLSYLGLTFQDLDTKCPIQIASTGHSKVMIGIKNNDKLNSLKPNFRELAQFSKRIGCNGYYAFNINEKNSETLTNGRMFAPAIGINEDPVTGNANGPLGAYLVHNNLVDISGDTFTFKGSQGEAIKRNGVVEVFVSIKNKRAILVRIAGEAVIVFKASLEI
ncbi:MAG: hypothetical protein CSA42_07900 [Gammaproteobacteria bacterium]|nr:MAG: hypothetical protein CSA42_07900 [Gammaproteobacteria bacterium]